MREELDNIINKYKLIERTLEAFWENYDNYLDEEPSESNEIGLIG